MFKSNEHEEMAKNKILEADDSLRTHPELSTSSFNFHTVEQSVGSSNGRSSQQGLQQASSRIGLSVTCPPVILTGYLPSSCSGPMMRP
jgi:hypothetical protein